jgi:hypothetical protein
MPTFETKENQVDNIYLINPNQRVWMIISMELIILHFEENILRED